MDINQISFEIFYSVLFSAVKHPAKVLANLPVLPKIVRGKIVAGQPATVTLLMELPKGTDTVF